MLASIFSNFSRNNLFISQNLCKLATNLICISRIFSNFLHNNLFIYPRRSRSFHASNGLAQTSVQSTSNHLHWLGSTDTRKEPPIAVENCYGSVALQTVFVSTQMLPARQKNFVIYECKCHCDSQYVGSCFFFFLFLDIFWSFTDFFMK